MAIPEDLKAQEKAIDLTKNMLVDYPPEEDIPIDQDMAALEEEEESEYLWETNHGKAILDMVKTFEEEETWPRYRNILKYRKHLYYWNSIQYLAESSVAHDWMTPDDILEENPRADIDPALYAKVVNVFKANGEILIGALTSGTPTVRFFPKDANESEDVLAAKSRTKIADLIQRHNKARMLLMKAMFILYNQSFVACYNENKADYRFGQVQIAQYEDIEVVQRQNYCAACGFELGQETLPPGENAPPMAPEICPNCGTQAPPEFEDMQGQQQVPIASKTLPKTRETLEVYGPLNVKVPLWVKDQESTPYLILETEESVYMMREIYPEIADKITSPGYPADLESENRIPSAYYDDFPRSLCLVKRVWLRPWTYNYWVQEEDKLAELKQKYPNGLYAVIINDGILAECVPDKLDDHWTILEHPLAETIHAEPIATPMVHLQDITNELTNLTLETIEFGIPEVFADTRVLDFESYPRQEARPGQISPATAPTGQGLANGFHEVKPATLSREIEPFAQRVEQMTQLVMGSYPSVYGGTMEGGGGTAREYETSRAAALQRLGTVWIIVQQWWADVMAKATKSFAENMLEDEKYVQQQGNNFINVWIRKTELMGEVGDVLPEVSEALPASWSQKRDVIMGLMNGGNEDVAAVIRHPENAGLIASILGVPELYIPGDDDRNKQLFEIAQLILQQPTEGPPQMDPMTGMLVPGQLQSSIPVTPELDNHIVESEICKGWLKSDVGLDAKENNSAGYANVLAHLKEHLMFAQPPPAPMGGEQDMGTEGVAA